MKSALGELFFPDDLIDQLAGQGFEGLPVTVADGLATGALPRHREDPVDRRLVARAMRRELTILTADRRFGDDPVRLPA